MNLVHRMIGVPGRTSYLSFDILRRSRGPAAASDIVRIQARRLLDTLTEAGRSVPYYRRLFEAAGIRPAAIRSLDDLRRIPVTTRADLNSVPPEDLISSRYRRRDLLLFKTSGATGIPLSVYRSRADSFLLHLIKLRTLRALGLAWRDRMIKIHSRYHSDRPPSWRVLQGLGLLRQTQVDPLAPENLAAILRGKRADVLMGYTGFLVRLAQVLADDKERTLRPRFLVGGSETMTPFIREQIQRGFGVPVRDTYICQEVGMVAWECPVSGLYHLVDDGVVVEVMKGGKPCRPGQAGEVVVTGLIGRAMPFIRYSLGDIAVLSDRDCRCGRQGPSFDRILGKMQDFFWLPDGREFNPWILAGLWTSRASWIRQYELVQEAPARIVLRIVPAASPPAQEVTALQAETDKILDEGISFQVEFVSEIKPDASGKTRIHRCRVRSLYDNPADAEWLDSTARLEIV